ncbi:hypothetical protein [Streptomyces sp. NPDC005533]|uniref:hypothetical protein n=1 Tax=Streptomyces sp. NPDC005533 TaxID=3364723 RepID=UPI0036B6069E
MPAGTRRTGGTVCRRRRIRCQILNEIRNQAPNAKIVLVGYPGLFSPTACIVEYDDREVALFNSWADVLDDRMRDAAGATGDVPSRGSLHPSELGTTAYAEVLQEALNGTLH